MGLKLQVMDNLKKTGNIEQVAFTKRIEYKNGNAAGVNAILCKNGKLSLTLLESKALDIFDLSYGGNNMSFISKNGLVAGNPAHTPPAEFMKYFPGGFLYTCGLENIGKPEDGKPFHGSFSYHPSVIIKEQTVVKDGKIVLEIEGKIRDTALFSTEIETVRNYKIHDNKIILTDKITNLDFKEQSIIMLYHFNLGYPMLDACTKLTANIGSTGCRTGNCNLDKYNVMNEPVDDCQEEVFIHTFNDDIARIEVENSELKHKIIFTYDTRFLKYLTEWKLMKSGDYVLGIEPATSHIDNKRFIPLKNGRSIENKIEIEFFAGQV